MTEVLVVAPIDLQQLSTLAKLGLVFLLLG
jgi:hypothetical protein